MDQRLLPLHSLLALLFVVGGCVSAPAPVLGESSAAAVARRLEAASEDCTTPGDEDGDGLADCEDADCFTAPSCTESCLGGADEDADGLVDCADDDCWATCGVLVRSHLHGGAAELSWSSGAFANSFAVHRWRSAAGALRSLSGSVSLLTGTDTIVCAWSLSDASFATAFVSVSTVGSTQAGGHGGYSAALSSACPVPLGQHVLPPEPGGFTLSRGSHWRTPWVRIDASGGPWYSGEMELHNRQRYASMEGSSALGSGFVPALNPTTATWSP